MGGQCYLEVSGSLLGSKRVSTCRRGCGAWRFRGRLFAATAAPHERALFGLRSPARHCTEGRDGRQICAIADLAIRLAPRAFAARRRAEEPP